MIVDACESAIARTNFSPHCKDLFPTQERAQRDADVRGVARPGRRCATLSKPSVVS